MTKKHGWTDRQGIVWRSEGEEVLITSDYKMKEELYRICLNDEDKAEQVMCLRTNPNGWTNTVTDLIQYAEGYIEGKS